LFPYAEAVRQWLIYTINMILLMDIKYFAFLRMNYFAVECFTSSDWSERFRSIGFFVIILKKLVSKVCL